MPLHIEEDYLQKYGTKIIRDIEYKDHNGVYIPKKIVKMHFIKDKNGLNNNYNEVITVDNIEINSPINDSLFKIPFEKGIDVYDYRSNMKNKQKWMIIFNHLSLIIDFCNWLTREKFEIQSCSSKIKWGSNEVLFNIMVVY